MRSFHLHEGRWVEHLKGLIPLGTLLLALLGEGIAGLAPFPGISCCILCYWSLYHPNLVPPIALLVAGVLADSLMGQALGITFLQLFLLFCAVLAHRRLLLQAPPVMIWMWFWVYLFLFCGLWLGIDAFYHTTTWGEIPPMAPDLGLALVWVGGIFPLVFMLLSRIRRWM